MSEYNVVIERKLLDVYTVEARSGADAAFKIATAIASDNPPTPRTTELSRKVHTPRPTIEEFIASAKVEA